MALKYFKVALSMKQTSLDSELGDGVADPLVLGEVPLAAGESPKSVVIGPCRLCVLERQIKTKIT